MRRPPAAPSRRRRDALDRRPARPADGEEADRSPTRSRSGHRLRQPRTILSIAIPLVLLVLGARLFLNIDVQLDRPGHRQREQVLLLAAFGVFYLGFPLRGLRWG